MYLIQVVIKQLAVKLNNQLQEGSGLNQGLTFTTSYKMNRTVLNSQEERLCLE